MNIDKHQPSLKSNNNSRHFICQIYATRRIILFNPKHSKHISKTVDFWNNNMSQTSEETTQFNKTEYIEILLHPGQILYIPPYWRYTSESKGNNITIEYNSFSFFDKLFNPIDYIQQLF